MWSGGRVSPEGRKKIHFNATIGFRLVLIGGVLSSSPPTCGKHVKVTGALAGSVSLIVIV